MKTKKQMKTKIDWGVICYNNLKDALKSKDFKGKTELNKCKDLKALPSENIFKYILISYGKLKLVFPLTQEEYIKYKGLEAQEWNKK